MTVRSIPILIIKFRSPGAGASIVSKYLVPPCICTGCSKEPRASSITIYIPLENAEETLVRKDHKLFYATSGKTLK